MSIIPILKEMNSYFENYEVRLLGTDEAGQAVVVHEFNNKFNTIENARLFVSELVPIVSDVGITKQGSLIEAYRNGVKIYGN